VGGSRHWCETHGALIEGGTGGGGAGEEEVDTR